MGIVFPESSKEAAGDGPVEVQPRTRLMTLKMRPHPKGRPRMTKTGRVYTPKETVAYEKAVGDGWLRRKHMTFTGPVHVDIHFFFKRPKSHYGAKGLKASAPKYHTQTPDLDNIEKAVLDGLNKIAYTDDKQVIGKNTKKSWSDDDMILVAIYEAF